MFSIFTIETMETKMVVFLDYLFTVLLQVQTDSAHSKPIPKESVFTKHALLVSTLLPAQIISNKTKSRIRHAKGLVQFW